MYVITFLLFMMWLAPLLTLLGGAQLGVFLEQQAERKSGPVEAEFRI